MIYNLESFDKIISSNSNKIKLIQFSADWCSSCGEFQTTFDELQKIYSNDILEFYKINIDNYPDLAEEYNINSLPTFLFFKNGQMINFIIGNAPVERFNRVIKSLTE